MILQCHNPLVESILSSHAIPPKGWWQGKGGSNAGQKLLISKANPVFVQTFDGRVKSLIAGQINFPVFVLPDSRTGVKIFEFCMNRKLRLTE